MACIESVCYAGRTKQIRAYYSAKYNDGKLVQKEKREKKGKPTSEKQAEINRRNSLRTLTRIMDANFSGKDLYVTYTVEKDKRFGNPKKFRACIKMCIRDSSRPGPRQNKTQRNAEGSPDLQLKTADRPPSGTDSVSYTHLQ